MFALKFLQFLFLLFAEVIQSTSSDCHCHTYSTKLLNGLRTRRLPEDAIEEMEHVSIDCHVGVGRDSLKAQELP